MGTLAEAFPSVQVSTPGQGFGGEVKGGKKGLDEPSDPQLFSSLMAQYASVPGTEREAEPPALERVFAALKGGLFQLSPEALKLLASLKEGLQREAPEVLPLMKEAAEEALNAIPEEELRRLEALLSRAANRLGMGEGGALAEVGTQAQGTGAAERISFGASLLSSQVLRTEGPELDTKDGSADDEDGLFAGTSADGDPSDSDPVEGGGAPRALSLLAEAAALQQGAAPEGSGGRPELKEVPAAKDRGADSTPIAVPPDRPEPAGELLAGEAGEDPLLSRLPGARREMGRKVSVSAEESEAGEQAASAPDGDEGPGVGSALRSPHEGAGREGGREPGGDASRRRSRGAEAARSHSSEELPRSAERTESRPDFQFFFDGILANRRSAQPSAAPLELSRGAQPGEVLREGVENVVRFARVNGGHRASLIVDPPALGRLTVELATGTSGLEANIKVSSEQVRQLVQDQIVQLRMSLAQQGVQLAQFSVDVQQDDGRRQQGFSRGQGGRRRARGEASGEDDGAENAVFRVDLNQGLLHWVA